MEHDDRHGERGNWRGRDWNRDRGEWRQESGRGENRDYDRGYGRDPSDRNPGAHVDYYRGGDRGQQRMGPEGGFEMRGDYRRTERYADQGKSRGRGDRDEDRRFSSSGEGGVNQAMGAYGGNRDSGYGIGGDGAAGYQTGGSAGPGFAPEFGAGPRFDRQDPGSTGTHGAHPVASPYGEAQTGFGRGGFGAGSSARAQAIVDQDGQGGRSSRSHQDPHYSEWRRQQIEALDRDYDEYCRENASRFESEFGSWREQRGRQRQSLGRVRERMDVVGSDGEHVGTVDKVAGDRIILTKNDPNAGGHHHSIPCSWIDRVEDRVTINKGADEAMQAWRDEETSRALFERPDSGSTGPHILERSFSGTYRDE